MNKLALLAALPLGLLGCSSQPDPPKPASAPEASVPAPSPMAAAASKAWQASYAAESAGNFEAALNALSDLPSPQSAGYLASYRRGWLQYRLGRHGDAVAAYSTAMLLEPGSIEARVARLAPLVAQSKWPEVVSDAEEVLKRDPENYLALSRLAFAQYSQDNFAEAEQLYRRVAELYPSDIDARSGLAWALLRLGKPKDAASLFTQVLEVSSTHTMAQRGLHAATRSKRSK